MRAFIKKNYIYIATFLVPVFILVLVYAIRRVYPFGENSVLVLDLNAQYVYYYEAFRDAFFNGKSLLYSFSRTLGGEMVGIYAYYLASPFSFILLLFPKIYMTEAVLCMILLKVGTAAVTFAIYLKQSRNASNYPMLIFSLMYSLMSYMIIQTMNPMWIDGLIMLPLIVLGVERLIVSGKYFMFTITLALLFISNFYIGYMTGFFVFVYFIYYLLGKYERCAMIEKAKILLRFFGATALSIALSSWLLIPTYFSLKMGKLEFTNPDFTPLQNLDLFDLISKTLPVTYDSINYPGLPFIFSGTVVLLLAAYYFSNSKVSFREKVSGGSFIIFFIICFTISTIDIVLHGFQGPNWLNYRYSYILSFFMITLAYEGWHYLKETSRATFVKVMLIFSFFVAIVGRMNLEYIRPEENIWLSYFLLIIYTGILYLMKVKDKRKILNIILLAFIMIEMAVNSYAMVIGAHNEVYYSNRPSYRDFFDRLYPVTDYLKEYDSGFYRTETFGKRTVNDPMALGINGISHSSSTLNAGVIDMMFSLGFSSREHWTKYRGATIVTDSLFGIKYLLSESEINTVYESIFEYDDIELYKNPHALPIAFVASDDVLELELESFDPFINQNALLSALLGVEYKEYFKLLTINEIIFENIKTKEMKDVVSYIAINPDINAHIEYLLETAGNNEMYMYLYSKYPREANVWLNKEFIGTFFDNETTCILPLGVFPNRDQISLITTPIEENYYLNNNMFYYLDESAFEKDIERLIGDNTEIVKISESEITVKLLAEENEILFTTIPYDRGWRVKVNGKNSVPLETLDSLMAIELESGQQEISLKFIPYGSISGIIISLLSLITLYYLYRIGRKRKVVEKVEDAEESNEENNSKQID